jgi:hypothetical protein
MTAAKFRPPFLIGNALNVYSADAEFESQLEHQLDWQFIRGFLEPLQENPEIGLRIRLWPLTSKPFQFQSLMHRPTIWRWCYAIHRHENVY